MLDKTNLIGLELVVRGIDDALPICVDGFGWTVVYDGPAADVGGRSVVLDAGSITVTLLEPSESGAGILSDRRPRLSQLVVGGDTSAANGALDRLTALGVPTQTASSTRRFVPPEAVDGVLGFETALVLQAIDEDTAESSPSEE